MKHLQLFESHQIERIGTKYTNDTDVLEILGKYLGTKESPLVKVNGEKGTTMYDITSDDYFYVNKKTNDIVFM